MSIIYRLTSSSRLLSITERNIVLQAKLTFFQNHLTASCSPVDSILLKFSLFVPFNRVNLWYFTIFFSFYFSDSYYIFKLPCMVSFESLHDSVWPWKRKTSGTSHRDSEPFVEKGPIGAMQRLKTDHAWQFKHVVWVRKIKTKKYYKIPEIYPVKRDKKRKIRKNEINRWTRCG